MEAKKRQFACSLQRPCLFDISRDPEERSDVAHLHPGTVEQLRQRLRQRFTEFHLTGVPRQSKADALAMVARWRDGYCSAALRHFGFMTPWKTASEPVRASYYQGTAARYGAPRLGVASS